MATTPSSPSSPSSPGGNNPLSSNGSQSPVPKPRATIILKNPNAKTTSSSSMPPATPSVPGNSARVAPIRPSIPAPNQSSRRSAASIQTDREALGLSASRPSEMVAGLGEAAKRAEALAMREEAKRKSGGKLNANIALHVDDTGRKWARWVQLGIALAVIVACIVGGMMLYGANHERLDPRRALAETRSLLSDLEITAKKMERFDAGETITVASAKSHMQKALDTQLEAIKKSLQHDKETGRTPDKALVQKRDEIEKLKQFTDGWNKPFEFAVAGDELEIRSTTKVSDFTSEPVKINLRGKSGN